jgi:hypothetical protein
MSFSIRSKKDVNYIFENTSTSSGVGGGLPAATTYGQYAFYDSTISKWVAGGNPVKIGSNAGSNGQGSNAVAIGALAGNFNQGANAVAVGAIAGNLNQGANAIAIGINAGNNGQGSNAIGIGSNAGGLNQGEAAIAIGFQCAPNNQGSNAIAIGRAAGSNTQGANAIAIGASTGVNNQPPNSIILNATGVQLDVSNSAFYVAPIRAIDVSTSVLVYNSTTKEIAVSPTKTFIIPHPYDSERYLVHGCLEGPEAGVYYRGTGEITNGEYVDISLPEYCKHFFNFTVNISPITHTLFSTSTVENGVFRVRGENGSFYWLVHATRHNIDVEPLVSDVNVKGEGPYKWIE